MSDHGREIRLGRDVFTPLDPGLHRAAQDIASALKADGGGLRYNEGKVKIELLPPEWTWGLASVMTRGSQVYAERNWERGMKWSIMIGCAARHTFKFICGQKYDAETGCHHLFMAAWNLCALASYDIRGIGTNDLAGEYAWLEKVAVEPNEAFKTRVRDAERAKA